MNTQTSPEQPETSATDVSVTNSPGAMIREARTRARMSLEDLAAATKLARHTLDALERDDFNALQEAVYVRGYYRKCAKILNLSEARLAEAYQGRVLPKRPDPPTKLRLASGTDIGAANPLPVPMAVFSAVAAVIVGILLWNLLKSPETPRSEAPLEEPITVAPSMSVSAPPTEAGTVAAPAEGAATTTTPTNPNSATPVVPAPSSSTSAPAIAPVAPAPAAATTPAPTPASAPAAAAPAPATFKPLSLKFSNTSWARIEDGSGKVLVNGLMRQGQVQSLNGQPPFSIFLGNGPGVQVEFDGQAVDFSRHISDNLTARFRIPEGG